MALWAMSLFPQPFTSITPSYIFKMRHSFEMSRMKAVMRSTKMV